FYRLSLHDALPILGQRCEGDRQSLLDLHGHDEWVSGGSVILGWRDVSAKRLGAVRRVYIVRASHQLPGWARDPKSYVGRMTSGRCRTGEPGEGEQADAVRATVTDC